MSRIILLAGPPGAGKTTIAAELVKLWDGPLAAIEGDVFWRFFVKPREDASVRDNFATLLRASTAAAVQFSRTGQDVLLDFSIPPSFLEAARKFAKDAPLHYVVVRPSFDLCAQRAAEREEGKMADYEPFRRLYSLFDEAPQHIISDDAASAADVAQRIKDGLALGHFVVA